MKNKVYTPFLWMGILILIVSLACGPTTTTPTVAPPVKESTPVQQVQPTNTVEPTPAPPTDTPVPEGLISNLQDAKKAIIQIEAQGSFVDPEAGFQYNSAGRGSGFIIDPSGIAVTNNHVVTGAALLKIWVGGDTSKSYNAKVLGVSECSDLAVIDIEGDGFPYMEWHPEAVSVGLEVYAAGFPLGDPEFTLTKGIVSKEKTSGETSWASVDAVIEHDAKINPGNSGGPLLDANGKVVGVNYAAYAAADQYFAIGKTVAISLIDQLRTGKDVDSIGVNGQAVVSDDGSISGIWVSSVKSGSPADKSGLKGGDIMTLMEGLILATDGSMSQYCDILRTHNPGDTLSIEVLRWLTQEYMAGQINGRALETTMNLASELTSEGVETSSTDTSAYSGYQTVTDDYGAIQVNIPLEWVDFNGSPWVSGEDVIGSGISAAADIDAYNNTWTESGIFFGVSDDLAQLGGYVQLLDIVSEDFKDSCKYEDRTDYEDEVYRGKYDLFSNCGDEGTWFFILTAVPKQDSSRFLILLEMLIAKDADLDALDKILASFDVIGTLP